MTTKASPALILIFVAFLGAVHLPTLPCASYGECHHDDEPMSHSPDPGPGDGLITTVTASGSGSQASVTIDYGQVTAGYTLSLRSLNR
jgi:hypothetical protein